MFRACNRWFPWFIWYLPVTSTGLHVQAMPVQLVSNVSFYLSTLKTQDTPKQVYCWDSPTQLPPPPSFIKGISMVKSIGNVVGTDVETDLITCYNEERGITSTFQKVTWMVCKCILWYEQKFSVASAKNESIAFWQEENLHQLSPCKDENCWDNTIKFCLIWMSNYYCLHRHFTYALLYFIWL